MTLTFELETTRDALAKAHREYQSLESAITSQDRGRIGDCLYNFSVSVYHVKDWLVKIPSSTYSKSDVEDHIKANPSLLIWRDLCNASKHRKITKYQPNTDTVTTSANAVFAVPSLNLGFISAGQKSTFRVKIITADKRRLEALALAREAISAWETFFRNHGL